MSTGMTRARKPKAVNTHDRSRSRGHRVQPIEWYPPAAAEGSLTHSDWAKLGWRLFDLPRSSQPSARARF
jgi:hypothetical protein